MKPLLSHGKKNVHIQVSQVYRQNVYKLFRVIQTHTYRSIDCVIKTMMRHAITVSGNWQIIFNRSDGLRQNNFKTGPPLLVLSAENKQSVFRYYPFDIHILFNLDMYTLVSIYLSIVFPLIYLYTSKIVW